MRRFFRWMKKEEKEDVKVETKPAEIQESKLKIKCREHGRPDLYDPLRNIILVEPRDRDVESLLSKRTYLDYSIAACVML